MKLFAIMKKNIKFLMHHKLSTAIVLFGPLILMILAGLAFSSNDLHGIKVGIHTTDDNNIIDSLVDLVKSEKYDVINYESIEKCQDDLKNDKVHMCLQYDDKEKNLKFFVDPSKTNLVYTLLNVMSNKMNTATDDLSYTLTTTMINQIVEMSKLIESKRDAIEEMIQSSTQLKEGLNNMSEEILMLELQFDPSSFDIDGLKSKTEQNSNRINQFKAIINARIYTSIDMLNKYDDAALNLENEIEKRKKDKKKINDDLNNAFTYYNCSGKSYEDLTQYSSDPDTLLEKIVSSSSPECSYIHTIQKNLDACTGDLNMASNKVSSLRGDMSQTKDELEQFNEDSNVVFKQVDSDLKDAENSLDVADQNLENMGEKVEGIKTSKKEIANTLTQMGEGVGQSLTFLVTFNDSLSNMTENINKIAGTNVNTIINPIINTVEGFDKNKNAIDYLFPTLIVFVIMFVGIMLGNILTTKEKNSRAFFRNLISPTNNYLILLGTFLTTFVIVLIQIGIIFLLAYLFMSLGIEFLITDIIIILVITISIFSCIGIILGNIIESEETSVIISVILSIILLIFSSTILPLEAMPVFAHIFVKINPFYLATQLLTRPLIYGISMFKNLTQFFTLIALLGIMIWLTFKSFKIAKRKIER